MGELDSSTVIEDVAMVSFLSLKGHIAVPFIKEEARDGKSSQVAWDVQGDIDKDVRSFYANELVGVRDFAKMMSSVRKDMYNVKQMNNQLKGRN